MPATYEPIATTTLGSTAATITFSSIPATYTDLRLVFTGASTSTTASRFKLNNDASTIYSYTVLAGDGSSVVSQRGTSTAYGRLSGPYVNPAAATVYLATLDIFSYAGSTYKTILGTSSMDKNGSGSAERTVQLYQSASAINRIDLFFGFSDTFTVGTTVTLYGIKAA
jgi:hypothetical protein